jgi:hypothetical protein
MKLNLRDTLNQKDAHPLQASFWQKIKSRILSHNEKVPGKELTEYLPISPDNALRLAPKA